MYNNFFPAIFERSIFLANWSCLATEASHVYDIFLYISWINASFLLQGELHFLDWFWPEAWYNDVFLKTNCWREYLTTINCKIYLSLVKTTVRTKWYYKCKYHLFFVEPIFDNCGFLALLNSINWNISQPFHPKVPPNTPGHLGVWTVFPPSSGEINGMIWYGKKRRDTILTLTEILGMEVEGCLFWRFAVAVAVVQWCGGVSNSLGVGYHMQVWQCIHRTYRTFLDHVVHVASEAKT